MISIKGACEASLDDKGRLAIPKRYRDQLPGDPNLVLTADSKKHLILYPADEWEQVAERLRELDSNEPWVLWKQRMLIGHAEEVKIDKSDRIHISQGLRDTCGITKDVKMVGQGNRIEIWDTATWNAELEKATALYEQAPPGIGKIRL